MTHTPLPLLVYDGDCGFCRLWIDRWRHLTGDRVEYAPFQQAASRFPDIPLQSFRRAVQFMEPEGSVYSGAEAVFRLLAHVPGLRGLPWIYRRVPGLARVSERAYRLVADHRPLALRLTHLLWGRRFEPLRYELTRWVFLRLLALLYLFAFLSLATQITGLAGSRGILPAAELLRDVRQEAGVERYWNVPTLAWIRADDAALRGLCFGGAILSAVAALGLLPVPVFSLLWLFYSSLVVVGQDFLAFQWDTLLLEAGFLAIFLGWGRQPSPTVIWLLRLLCFRLMFSSGAMKLASGDPSWLALAALNYHYETQPLPTPIGWLAHQLPGWFQTFSCLAMFGIELGAPLFIFGPRRLRLAAAGALAFLQALILLTGNYTVFNWLSLALCLLLLDDAAFRALVPARLAHRVAAAGAPERRPLRAAATALLAVLLVAGGAAQLGGIFWPGDQMPRPARWLLGGLSGRHILGHYGLFSVMTTSRPEIVLEASNDGETWLAYEFRYKPGDLQRAPPWVAPHQPRLDWQMWFAALEDYRSSPWFVNLVIRLLEGSPDVLALLEKNPFPDAPPRYLRASRYDYRFTGWSEWRSSGRWWRRSATGPYFPAASLPGR